MCEGWGPRGQRAEGLPRGAPQQPAAGSCRRHAPRGRGWGLRARKSTDTSPPGPQAAVPSAGRPSPGRTARLSSGLVRFGPFAPTSRHLGSPPGAQSGREGGPAARPSRPTVKLSPWQPRPSAPVTVSPCIFLSLLLSSQPSSHPSLPLPSPPPSVLCNQRPPRSTLGAAGSLGRREAQRCYAVRPLPPTAGRRPVSDQQPVRGLK